MPHSSPTASSKENLVTNLTHHKIQARLSDWDNFMGTVHSPGSVIVDIRTQQQAQLAMQLIHQANQDRETPWSIRAVAGWGKPSTCPISRFFSDLIHPEHRYRASYTANPATTADIIFRFHPNFGSMQMVSDNQVVVPAGRQLGHVEQFLSKKGKSLPTATMINKVTMIGAVENGCQGTGKDQPTLAGLVSEVTILMPDGTIKILTDQDEDFSDLIGANLGLAGIALSMQLKVVPQFRLRERVKHYTSLDDLKEDLPEALTDDYFTAMITPLYGVKQINDSLIPNIQVRRWTRTTDKITDSKDVHDYTVEDVFSELSAKIGGEVQNLLIREDMRHLLEAYLALVAVVIAAKRGSQDKVATANNTMHYQHNFPKDLNLVSFQLSVPEANQADILHGILSKGEEIMREMNQSNDHAIPVTYATYVRCINGTTGGLSTCPEKPGHRVLIVEYVTHPEAPGFQAFIQNMMAYYQGQALEPKFHLGKSLPKPPHEFFSPSTLDTFAQALIRWHGSESAALNSNPMFTPYLKSIFSMPMSAEEQIRLQQAKPSVQLDDDEEALKLLKALRQKLMHHKCQTGQEQVAVSEFCHRCDEKITELKASVLQSHNQTEHMTP